MSSKALSGSQGTPQGDTASVQRTVSDGERQRFVDAMKSVCFKERVEDRNLPASGRADWFFLVTDGGEQLVSKGTAPVVPQGTRYLVLGEQDFSSLLLSFPAP